MTDGTDKTDYTDMTDYTDKTDYTDTNKQTNRYIWIGEITRHKFERLKIFKTELYKNL